MINLVSSKWRIAAGLALLTAGAGLLPAQAVCESEKALIRGHAIDVHLCSLGRFGSQNHPKVIFVPGDGGWRGAAVSMATTMASWGYDVAGVDTKTYLESFTGTTTLQEQDVMNDFAGIATWAAPGALERVILVGWSEGAGLVVLAAASKPHQSKYLGVVTLGLSDRNILGWRWQDDLTYLTKREPNEPTFSSLAFIASLSPLPLAMLQSSRDEYVPMEESRKVFDAAREPKRYLVVNAQNHRFDGNQEEFYQRLRETLQWTEQAQARQ
jgi:dienelactone hydrolase